jgi:undecaprenyl-diphosphatase
VTQVIRELESRFPRTREISSSTRWLIVGGALASLVVFIVTAALLDDHPSEVDRSVEGSVEERPEDLTLLPMKALASASSARGSFFLLLGVGLFFAIRRRDWRPALLVGTAFVGVTILTSVLKEVFDRPAPGDWAAGEVSGSAFPSGHMAQAVAVWGTLALVMAMGRGRRDKKLLAAGTVLLVAGAAASRVALEAHWVTDVIAGTALGALWLAIVATLTFMIRSREQPHEPADETQARAPGAEAQSVDAHRRWA